MFKKKVSRDEFDKLKDEQWKLETRFRSLCELLGVAFTPDEFDAGMAVYMRSERTSKG